LAAPIGSAIAAQLRSVVLLPRSIPQVAAAPARLTASAAAMKLAADSMSRIFRQQLAAVQAPAWPVLLLTPGRKPWRAAEPRIQAAAARMVRPGSAPPLTAAATWTAAALASEAAARAACSPVVVPPFAPQVSGLEARTGR